MSGIYRKTCPVMTRLRRVMLNCDPRDRFVLVSYTHEIFFFLHTFGRWRFSICVSVRLHTDENRSNMHLYRNLNYSRFERMKFTNTFILPRIYLMTNQTPVKTVWRFYMILCIMSQINISRHNFSVFLTFNCWHYSKLQASFHKFRDKI